MSDWQRAQAQLAALAGRLGPSAKDWEISKWAPGDGWTRYRLVSGGNEISACYSRQEFAAFVAGMVALEHVLWQQRKDMT